MTTVKHEHKQANSLKKIKVTNKYYKKEAILNEDKNSCV